MNIKERFYLDKDRQILFIDFSNLTIETQAQVLEIQQAMEQVMRPLKEKVYAIVNYDDCVISNNIKDEYVKLIKTNQEKYSLGTVRYSNRSFTRTSLRLGAVKEGMLSHICNSKEDAIAKVEAFRSGQSA